MVGKTPSEKFFGPPIFRKLPPGAGFPHLGGQKGQGEPPGPNFWGLGTPFREVWKPRPLSPQKDWDCLSGNFGGGNFLAQQFGVPGKPWGILIASIPCLRPFNRSFPPEAQLFLEGKVIPRPGIGC